MNKKTLSIILSFFGGIALGLLVVLIVRNYDKFSIGQESPEDLDVAVANQAENREPESVQDGEATKSEATDSSEIAAVIAKDDSKSENKGGIAPKVILRHNTPEKKGDAYTVIVYGVNLPQEMAVCYKLVNPVNNKTIESHNGIFNGVPGNKMGFYTAYIVERTNKSNVLASEKISGFGQVDTQVAKMSASEFQSLLLNQRDVTLLGGRNPKVAKYVVVSVVGLATGERRPDDIQAVRDKIANGIWSSASVVSVSYDSNGKINAVTIRAIY